MKILKNSKLKTKLLIGNLLITLILISFNLVLYIKTKEEVKNEIHKELNLFNKSFSSFLEETIKYEIDSYFKTKAEEVNLFIDSYQGEDIDYNRLVTFVDRLDFPVGGITLYSNNKLLYTSFTSGLNELPEATGSGEYIYQGKTVSYFASYRKDINLWILFQGDKSILYRSLDIEHIKNQVSAFKFTTTGYTYILSDGGRFIMHPAYENQNVYDLDYTNNTNFANEILNKKNGRISYTWQNPWENEPREKLAVYTYIDTLNWIVVTSGYPQDFYAALKPIKLNILYITLALLVFNLLFFFYLQLILDKPVKKLTEDIKNLNPQEGFKYLDVDGTDELSIIAVTFNNLMMTIESYATYLETMVEEKTAELRKANKSLYHMTIYDKLTDIHNRSYIMEVLSRKFKDKEHFACVLFDIDYFKKVNDTYGHLGGDFILRELSQLVKSKLKRGMELARYGGEEFIVTLNMDSKQAYEFIEEVRIAIEQHSFLYNEHDIKITSSFGICLTNEVEAKTLEELIDYADAALYQSKNTGRNKTTLFTINNQIK